MYSIKKWFVKIDKTWDIKKGGSSHCNKWLNPDPNQFRFRKEWLEKKVEISFRALF